MLVIIPDKFKNEFRRQIGWKGIEVRLPEDCLVEVKRKDFISDTIRWKVWLRDNFTCKKCGARKFLQVDHIVPESKGGKTILKNLQTLCEKCNQKKKDKIDY